MVETGEQRRQKILKQLHKTTKPLSATYFATQFAVSRQIIVGDIALIRAGGVEITATTRGYLWPDQSEGFVGKLVCKHDVQQTRQELESIVNLGGEVIDVIVEHELYGELTGKLNLKHQQDIDDFLTRQTQLRAKLLSELTHGIHTHTIKCADEATFEAIRERLLVEKIVYTSF